MTTTQVFETSVTVNNNSPIQDYVHPDPFEMTPGFKPFTDSKIFNKVIHERWEISYVKLAQINFSSAH